MNPVSPKDAFSISELVDLSVVSRTKLFHEIREGRLIARKIGRRTVVLRDDWRDWLNGLPKTPSPHR